MEVVKCIHAAKFWIHRGLCNPLQNTFTCDGIHLNAQGYQALYIRLQKIHFIHPELKDKLNIH